VSPLHAKRARGTLPWRVDVTITGWPYYQPHDRQAKKCCRLRVRRPAAVSVCAAARGATQSGRTGWSDSDDGSVRCAGRTSVKSREISRDRSGKMATRIDRRFLATSDPLHLSCSKRTALAASFMLCWLQAGHSNIQVTAWPGNAEFVDLIWICWRNANWCRMSIADYGPPTHSHMSCCAGWRVICCGWSAYLQHATSIVTFGGWLCAL